MGVSSGAAGLAWQALLLPAPLTVPSPLCSHFVLLSLNNDDPIGTLAAHMVEFSVSKIFNFYTVSTDTFEPNMTIFLPFFFFFPPFNSLFFLFIFFSLSYFLLETVHFC